MPSIQSERWIKNEHTSKMVSKHQSVGSYVQNQKYETRHDDQQQQRQQQYQQQPKKKKKQHTKRKNPNEN